MCFVLLKIVVIFLRKDRDIEAGGYGILGSRYRWFTVLCRGVGEVISG